MFDSWQFALDVQQVMAARMLRLMTGRLTAREARRMVAEKGLAYSRAQVAGGLALLTRGPLAAGHATHEIYRRAVRANRRRLSNDR